MDNIKIPNHLAIILDGNGRWATSKGLPRTSGHKEGTLNIKTIAHHAFSLGINTLSMYCFSTENWKRDKEEVDYLMNLPIIYFPKYKEDLLKDDCKLMISGDLEGVPSLTRKVIEDAIEYTKNCKSHVLNLCFNYGSHKEIVEASKKIASEYKDGKLDIESLDERAFESYLYTKDLKPVDLVIRTAGEQRLSNFLLWQISYAEFYFPSVTWPEFSKEELDKALIEFTKRDRKYGGINK